MANLDTLDSSVQISKEEGVNGGQEEKGVEGSSKKVADEVAAVSKSSSPTKDAAPALPSPGSGLVPLRGSATNGLTSSSSGAPPLSMPHPKKFSHSDINKRFLEKNSPASSASQTPSTPSVNKPGSAIQKPVLQTTPSHSRLVTAKLTAEGQRSTITGPGWSRPPSTSSSSGPLPAAGPNSKPSPTGTTTAPGPAPVGKVIQPQPRGLAETNISKKDNGTKPAWGAAAKAPPLVIGNPEDFPTAAEVAQVRSAKMLEKKQAAQEAEAQKEALATEADAFRGVHLAPNVHHWDEDEGDDSNFLDEVIEFDDGRQYTVPHQEQGSAGLLGPTAGEQRESEHQDQPVSKEERFGDDFDRSWPRSRTSNASSQQRGQTHRSPSTASSLSVLHSPQDSSRVLFNERSNRLEPYSSHSQSRFGGPTKDSYFTRRGSRSEYVSSPTDSRGGRDAPPHTQGLQLLQRPGQGNGFTEDGTPSRHRGFGDHANFAPWHDNARPRDRDMSRRDYPGPSPMSRTFSQAFDHNRSRDHYNMPDTGLGGADHPRRYSHTGPPPSSPSLVDGESRDGRQLPPHLSESHSSSSMWRSPSSESTQRQTAALSVESSSVQARSPVVSHVSLSPLHVDSPLQAVSSTLPLVDIEDVRKAAMHSAAERARLRRQQEEMEREKEKERARKKAAEIEAKIKAAQEKQVKVHNEPTAAAGELTQEAEAKAVEFIEHAVGSIVLGAEPPEEKPTSSPATAQRLPFTRTSSARGGSRANFVRRNSSSSGVNGNDPSLTEANSWRTKSASSRPPHTFEELAPVPATQPPHPPKLPLLAEVESFNIEADDSVEVVDFADHGKLVGAHERSSPTIAQPLEQRVAGPAARPSRPVATDFFDDKGDIPRPVPPHASNDEGSWRRKASLPPSVEQEDPQVIHVPKDKPNLEITPAPYEPPSPSAQWKGYSPADNYGRPQPDHGQSGHPTYNHSSLRSPVTPSYREAPMAALTDTMARIKGALDGMHTKIEAPRKWVPPSLRERSIPVEKSSDRDEHDEHVHREIFDVTRFEPPRSPKPAWNHFMVRLPRISPASEPIPQRRLRLFGTTSQMRLDIFSFVPPIEGMHRRDFQFNDYLFRKPFMSKGRIRYTVSLPGGRPSDGKQTPFKLSGPVVNLPANTKGSDFGVFGRSSEADGAASWRRPATSNTKAQRPEDEVPRTLDTVSRSPPPDIPSQKLPEKREAAVAPPVSVPATKARSQPKLPEGSAVAFYRDSRVNSSESQPKPTVSFIVSSELEEDLPRLNGAPDQKGTNGVLSMPQATTSSLITTSQESSMMPVSCSSVNDPIIEFHKNSHSPIHAPITPRTQTSNLSWKSPKDPLTKDLTSRVADSEHLKTVWSTTANQSDKPSDAALEEFPSDLVAPFPVRDTKLEESVKSSTHVHPSKMSLSDVTRSFQQVPTSTGSGTVVPHPTSPPTFRQPQIMGQSQLPMMPTGMRPPYAGYPSPMMSSPSPNMMYAQAMTPSPIPRPMVPATSPQYPPAPMWVPMPGGVPTGMMRPYGAQLMPYPAMYPASPLNMQGNNPSQPNGAQGRPPGMMMSPVAAPAQANMPMYATSPVLMPAMPAMQGMPGSAYPGAGSVNGRGQPQRGAYENVPSMMQQASYGTQPSAYSTAQPNSYVRSAW